MAMRSPSSPPRRDLVPRDSPQADSLLPTPQGGSGNGARADVARKTKEVDHLLAKLENEGVEIDGKIASIIDDEVARIKAEASREHVNNTKENVMTILLTVASVAVGFIMGAEWYVRAFCALNAKPREDPSARAKSRRAWLKP